MKIIINKPYEKDRNELLLDYYANSKENNGSILKSKVTETLIQNELDSEIMYNYDINYSIAYNIVENLYNDENTIYFGMYDKSNNLVAHTKCELEYTSENTCVAYISDIIIHNKNSIQLLNNGTEYINNIYLFFVDTIEKYINDHKIIIDTINYVLPSDEKLINVLKVKSYEDNSLFEETYTKSTRKRDLFDARGNSVKQRKK